MRKFADCVVPVLWRETTPYLSMMRSLLLVPDDSECKLDVYIVPLVGQFLAARSPDGSNLAIRFPDVR
jgi:hypothetical protein